MLSCGALSARGTEGQLAEDGCPVIKTSHDGQEITFYSWQDPSSASCMWVGNESVDLFGQCIAPKCGGWDLCRYISGLPLRVLSLSGGGYKVTSFKSNLNGELCQMVAVHLCGRITPGRAPLACCSPQDTEPCRLCFWWVLSVMMINCTLVHQQCPWWTLDVSSCL